MQHKIEDLIEIFNGLFSTTYNTVLVAGADEPLYQPSGGEGAYHEIHSRYDYFSSGLHEIAHWCIAGEKRRQLEDFGYWYAPDGRSEEQQQQFEIVEIKPQALEWIFSKAAGLSFKPSLDNLDNPMQISSAFYQNITTQARSYIAEGMGQRAADFAAALSDFYQQQEYANPSLYQPLELK